MDWQVSANENESDLDLTQVIFITMELLSKVARIRSYLDSFSLGKPHLSIVGTNRKYV